MEKMNLPALSKASFNKEDLMAAFPGMADDLRAVGSWDGELPEAPLKAFYELKCRFTLAKVRALDASEETASNCLLACARSLHL